MSEPLCLLSAFRAVPDRPGSARLASLHSAVVHAVVLATPAQTCMHRLMADDINERVASRLSGSFLQPVPDPWPVPNPSFSVCSSSLSERAIDLHPTTSRISFSTYLVFHSTRTHTHQPSTHSTPNMDSHTYYYTHAQEEEEQYQQHQHQPQIWQPNHYDVHAPDAPVFNHPFDRAFRSVHSN